MRVSMPLEKMSVIEKLQAMESLLDSLCRETTEIKSPAWHSEILSERENALKTNFDNFDDWHQAKLSIHKETK